MAMVYLRLLATDSPAESLKKSSSKTHSRQHESLGGVLRCARRPRTEPSERITRPSWFTPSSTSMFLMLMLVLVFSLLVLRTWSSSSTPRRQSGLSCPRFSAGSSPPSPTEAWTRSSWTCSPTSCSVKKTPQNQQNLPCGTCGIKAGGSSQGPKPRGTQKDSSPGPSSAKWVSEGFAIKCVITWG